MTNNKINLTEIENIAESMHVGDITRHEIKMLCKAVRAAKLYASFDGEGHDKYCGIEVECKLCAERHEKLMETLSAFDFGDES